MTGADRDLSWPGRCTIFSPRRWSLVGSDVILVDSSGVYWKEKTIDICGAYMF